MADTRDLPTVWRIVLLTTFALCCFAANSLLCRAALRNGAIDPASFTLIRVTSGAAVLQLLLRRRGSSLASEEASWLSAAFLVAYAAFFSMAYIRLDAGVGALILFGVVQITMIAGSMRGGRRPLPREWFGTLLALFGLGWMTLPGKDAPDLESALMMMLAGISWGLYSLRGRRAINAMAATAHQFFRGVPFALLFSLLLFGREHVTPKGAALAIVSGAITSGVGYTAWYAVIPRLGAIKAAALQLAVPVLALVAAMLFLREAATLRGVLAGALILGGVALTVLRKTPRKYPVTS